MTITWSRGFPVEHRRWVGNYIRRCARALGLDDWEIALDCEPGGSNQLAGCDAVPGSRRANIGLTRSRLGDRELAKADLRHELVHVQLWEIHMAIRQLFGQLRAARYAEVRDTAHDAYEHAIETLAAQLGCSLR